MLGFQRDADDGAGLPLGHFVDALGEAGIGIDVGNEEAFAVLGDPSGDAFAEFEADGLEGLGGVADGDGEIELPLLLVDHEEGPGVGPEVLGHLLHDGLEDGVEVQRGRQRLGDVVKNSKLL